MDFLWAILPASGPDSVGAALEARIIKLDGSSHDGYGFT
jgi:hypothetical protein